MTQLFQTCCFKFQYNKNMRNKMNNNIAHKGLLMSY